MNEGSTVIPGTQVDQPLHPKATSSQLGQPSSVILQVGIFERVLASGLRVYKGFRVSGICRRLKSKRKIFINLVVQEYPMLFLHDP